MAEKDLNYNINVNTGNAEKNVKNLNDGLKNTDEQTKKTSKGFKSLESISNLASKGLKGIGTAFKGAGIGVVVGALAALGAMFKSNQKVLDALNTGLNFIKLSFTAVSSAVSSAFEKASELTGGFDGLGKVIKGVINLAIKPLQLQFNLLKLGLQSAKLAYEKVFGDDESVEKAKADIKETRENIIQLGKDFAEAGKQVVNNFGEAISEVGTAVKNVVSEVGKIEPKKILESAEAMTKLENNSQLAEARITGLIEQYDRQAERLRQVRDEERNTIEERRKANDELKEVLAEQSREMLKQADILIANARAKFNANKNIENEVALINALNERKAVLAQIEGFISEQKINDLGLDKESLELTQAKSEAENALSIRKKRFIAEQITDDEMRIEALKTVLEEEKRIELERLQAKKDSYKEGTQAYVDAEIELNAKKQEFYEQEVALDNEKKKIKEDKKLKEKEDREAEIERLAEQAESDLLTFEAKRALLQEQRELILQDELLTNEERQKALALNLQKEIGLEEQKRQQKEDTFNKIIGLANAESKVGKALLIAKSLLQAKELVLDFSKTISLSKGALARSQVAISEGVAQTAKVGFPQNIPLLVGYAAQAAGIISSVRSAAKGAGEISAPNIDIGSAQATNFSPQSSLAQQSNIATINQQNTPQIVQAYVASNDITSQQALDRNIVQQASI